MMILKQIAFSVLLFVLNVGIGFWLGWEVTSRTFVEVVRERFLKNEEKHSFELYEMYHKGFDIGFDRAKLNCP